MNVHSGVREGESDLNGTHEMPSVGLSEPIVLVLEEKPLQRLDFLLGLV